MQAGASGEAAAALEAAIRLQPDHPQARVQLGRLRVAERPEETRWHFEQALRVEPNLADAYAGLGDLAALGDRIPEAAAHYQRALEADPNHIEANVSFAGLLAAQGRFREARRHLDLLLRIALQHGEAQQLIATLPPVRTRNRSNGDRLRATIPHRSASRMAEPVPAAQRNRTHRGLQFRHLPYVYLLRFPLLGALILGALGPVSFFAARSLLRGVFDIGPVGLAFTVFLALVAVFAFTLATMLVLEHGQERFFAAELPEHWNRPVYAFEGQAVSWAGRRLLRFYLLSAVILIGFAVVGCRVRAGCWGAAAGLAAGILLAGAGLLVSRWSWRRMQEWILRAPARMLLGSWQGYLVRTTETDAQGEPLWRAAQPARLLPGHGMAAVFLGLYLAIYLCYFAGVAPGWPAATLASLLVLLTLVVWGFAGLAFLLDRFRIPVLLPVGLLLLFGAQWPESDHNFPTIAGSTVAVSPRDVVRTLDGDSMIVVCAAGGGIQAGAWTAKVLVELERAFPEEFSRRVRLISSVSGGSAGSLYFNHAYRDRKLDLSQDIFGAATRSSLDYAAHGLVYTDLVRSVVPPLAALRPDRGQLLEGAWQRHLSPQQQAESLNDWRRDVLQGKRPAHIFNSTIAETGERFIMASVDLASSSARQFSRLYGPYQRAINPATAARLSATFPYVSPVARIDHPVRTGLRYHFADGGYFDNDGVVSAVDFLNEALPRDPNGKVKRVLLLQIRLGEGRSSPAQGQRGWFFQFLAPLTTLSRMRSASQGARNQSEVEMLREVMGARGISLVPLVIPYPGDDPPLSWHLLRQDIDAIDNKWKERGPQWIGKVGAFLNASTP